MSFKSACSWALIAVGCCLNGGLLAAAGSPATMKPQPESTRRMIERLSVLPQTSNPFVTTFLVGKAAEILGERMRHAANPRERLELKLSYATALLNNGQTADALKQLEEYDQMLNEPGLEPTIEQATSFLTTLAVAHLRQGEQENCLINHNADSCLLPIRGGGVHIRPAGSRAAIATLNDLLQINPTPNAVWLLNIAYMTLGEYPAKVPPAWLIPPAVFESEYPLPRFPDVAGALGLDVDDLAGGVVMDDFDHDGFLDLMVSGSGFDSQLRVFRNNGDGTFTERTVEAGLAGLTGGLNLVSGDYNNDGFVDVLVLRGGWLGRDGRYPCSLLRNNGDFTFTDVTEEAGLLRYHPTQTAVWFDYNGDGWLDLFIGNETVPGSGAEDPCELFRNNGDGTFTECAAENGLAVTDWIKAVACGDFNNDGRPDLYLSSLSGANYLFRNDGPADGAPASPRARWRFTNVAAAAGVTEPMKSFPCWFWDYDNDGWLDLFVSGYSIKNAGDIAADYLGVPTNAERPRLYHNNRDGTFRDVTKEVGLYRVLETMGSNFGDLDNDGWLDFYAGTGDPSLGTLIPNRMFRNHEGRRFQDVTTAGGFGQLQKGHGIAFGDLNNDGAPDIYSVVGGAFSGDHYHNQLFANPGVSNHYLKLGFTGVQSNRVGIGARIKVVVRTSAGLREIHRVVGTGGSFGCSPLRQEIGLGQAQAVERVEVTWPVTGRTQVFTGLQLDRTYAIREDQPTATEVKLRSFPWPAPGTGAHHHHVTAPELCAPDLPAKPGR
jgi:hypothetical protein